mmetsp:Transcript_8896/g.25627  ORF Transcript_8896/g.25627 Transcript_8896/m.25627 type:complete len:331 (+) Transcript_8896:463-1455(+)
MPSGELIATAASEPTAVATRASSGAASLSSDSTLLIGRPRSRTSCRAKVASASLCVPWPFSFSSCFCRRASAIRFTLCRISSSTLSLSVRSDERACAALIARCSFWTSSSCSFCSCSFWISCSAAALTVASASCASLARAWALAICASITLMVWSKITVSPSTTSSASTSSPVLGTCFAMSLAESSEASWAGCNFVSSPSPWLPCSSLVGTVVSMPESKSPAVSTSFSRPVTTSACWLSSSRAISILAAGASSASDPLGVSGSAPASSPEELASGSFPSSRVPSATAAATGSRGSGVGKGDSVVGAGGSSSREMLARGGGMEGWGTMEVL